MEKNQRIDSRYYIFNSRSNSEADQGKIFEPFAATYLAQTLDTGRGRALDEFGEGVWKAMESY